MSKISLARYGSRALGSFPVRVVRCSHRYRLRAMKETCDVPRPYLATNSTVQWKPFPPLLSTKYPGAQGRATTQGDTCKSGLSGVPGCPGVSGLFDDDQGALWHLGRYDGNRAAACHCKGRCYLAILPSPERMVTPVRSSHSSVGTACRRLIERLSLKSATVNPDGRDLAVSTIFPI